VEAESGPHQLMDDQFITMTNQEDTSELCASIIIPVYNNSKGLIRTLKALETQSVPRSCFEVIVVDNGSDDPPVDICAQYDVKYACEQHYLGSPYSARNRGFELAQGSIIVLLDATCAPSPKWLESGLDALQQGSDLVGGEVEFDISPSSTAAEIYDSLTN